VLFLPQDRYTQVKGGGALSGVGLQEWSLPVGLAASGLLFDAAIDLWHQREAVRRHLSAFASAIAESRRRHVEAIREVVARRRAPGEPAAAAAGGRPSRAQVPAPAGEWVEAAHDSLATFRAAVERDAFDREIRKVERRAEQAEAWARSLETTLQRKDAEMAAAQAALAEAFERAEAAEAHRRTDTASPNVHHSR